MRLSKVREDKEESKVLSPGELQHLVSGKNGGQGQQVKQEKTVKR